MAVLVILFDRLGVIGLRPQPVMTLEVAQISWADVYKDIARIPELYRRDQHGNVIPEGRICKLTVGPRSILLSVRGQQEHSNPVIHLDDKTRSVLHIQVRDHVDAQLRPVTLLGQFLWVWRASDPAYRLAARVGLLSILLSLIGAILSLIGLARG
jgi:hypothetical protein